MSIGLYLETALSVGRLAADGLGFPGDSDVIFAFTMTAATLPFAALIAACAWAVRDPYLVELNRRDRERARAARRINRMAERRDGYVARLASFYHLAD